MSLLDSLPAIFVPSEPVAVAKLYVPPVLYVAFAEVCTSACTELPPVDGFAEPILKIHNTATAIAVNTAAVATAIATKYRDAKNLLFL